MKPLVSVVIPVYNSEDTIHKTLQSVIDQTYDNFEILLIDDGSKDTSKEKIDDFIRENPTFNISYTYQENKGASAARNVGLKNAKGKYIALLDSDDVWDRDKIALQLEAFSQNREIDLLATNRNDEKFSSFLGHKFGKITRISTSLLLYKNFLLTPTVLFKKSIIDEVGYFDESMTHAEDLNYFLRISIQFNCFLYNESLVTTGFGKPTFGHSGLSKDTWKMGKGELKNIRLAYRLNALSFMEYIRITLFSSLKFCRRLIITAFR